MFGSSTLRRFVGLAAAALVVLGAPASVAAHTDVDYTLPIDGATMGEPLTEVTVAFTQPVTLVGPGFEVLSPQGEVTQPFVVTDDDMVFRLQIDPPMGGGDVGVRYEVTAPDGHVISGSFSFTVSAEAPEPTVATTAPPSVASSVAEPESPQPDPTVGTEAPATAAPVVTAGPESAEPEVVAAPAADPAPAVGDGTDDGGDGGGSGLLIAVAAAIAIGAAAFLFFRRRASA